MTHRPRGRAYKITRKQVRSYGYANRPGAKHRPNAAGVTTIAAINGKGAYSARRSMRGLSRSRRLKKARRQFANATGTRKPTRSVERDRNDARGRRRAANRHPEKLSAGDSSAFAKKLRAAKQRAGKTTRKTMKTRTRRRKSAPKRAGVVRRRRKVARRSATAVARKRPAARRRRKTHRKNSGTSAGARKGWRTRRAHAGKRRATRKTRRSTGAKRGRRLTPAQRLHLKRSRASRKAARTRRTNRVARHMTESMKRGHTPNGRRRRVRRHRKNAMVENRRRRSKAARRRPRRRSRKLVANRRRHRRNGRHVANRRRSHSRRHTSNRRRTHRRNRRHTANRRRSYRRNPSGVLMTALMSGLFVAGGLVAEKIVGGLIRDKLLSRLTGSVATATPPAASGLEALQPYNGLIASAAAAAIGALVANKLIKDPTNRNLVIAGVGAGFIHTALMFVLDKVGQPALVAALSGGDGTAVRLAAMYGMGAASIQPQYAPIGEYFQSGVGEYFASGVQGVGAYESNPDMYQAAAGVGADDNAYGHSNHVMPGSNLDRELSIAEAAAGIGTLQPYEAAAGFGEYFASGVSGLGATVGSRSTWIPGQSNPQLWAGTRGVSQPQAATEMTPAGLLETSGGQGIFG